MSIVGLLLVVQAASPLAAAPVGEPLPDIEIRADADIRSLEIRSRGEARLELRADPGIAPPVQVERTQSAGQSRYRNLRIGIRGLARLTAPEPISAIEAHATREPR